MTAIANYIDRVPPTVYESEDTNLDTAKLVSMIQSKNDEGFHILYDKYGGALYGILFKLVRRTEIAEDLLQDVFVKIWKNIDSFNPAKGTLFTWMLNIARNRAIDYLRSSCHKNELLNVDYQSFSLRKEYEDPNASNIGMIEMKDLQNKALQLEAKYAEVIGMIFFYGYTHEQTARIVKLPLGTVKTRARKGMSMLKKIYLQ